MKRIPIILLSFIFCLPVISQEKYVYFDTLKIVDSYYIVDSITAQLKDRGVPDEVIQMFINRNFSNSQSLSQYQKRDIITSGDTSFISLDYSPNNSNTKFSFSTMKFYSLNGTLYKYNFGIESYIQSKIPETSQTFHQTGKSFEILGYQCKEYISSDSVYKIYVSEEFPKKINPGVGVKNINGAILRFEVINGKAITTSTLHSIEKIKNVI